MSLASELLHSTSKRRAQDREPEVEACHPVQRLLSLHNVVHALICEHEPADNTEAALRADLRIMHLSGLVGDSRGGALAARCRDAAAAMAELIRLLPKCRE